MRKADSKVRLCANQHASPSTDDCTVRLLRRQAFLGFDPDGLRLRSTNVADCSKRGALDRIGGAPAYSLKGYILANITDTTKRNSANTLWRERVQELGKAGKEVEADAFKAWLRSQYATKIGSTGNCVPEEC